MRPLRDSSFSQTDTVTRRRRGKKNSELLSTPGANSESIHASHNRPQRLTSVCADTMTRGRHRRQLPTRPPVPTILSAHYWPIMVRASLAVSSPVVVATTRNKHFTQRCFPGRIEAGAHRKNENAPDFGLPRICPQGGLLQITRALPTTSPCCFLGVAYPGRALTFLARASGSGSRFPPFFGRTDLRGKLEPL